LINDAGVVSVPNLILWIVYIKYRREYMLNSYNAFYEYKLQDLVARVHY